MKHLITTIILLIAAAVVTVVYFKSLNQPGRRPAEVMQHIPDDASFVAEFNNDDGFYDAFSGSRVLTAIAGIERTKELSLLRSQLLQNKQVKEFFNNQHIYISTHPLEGDDVEFLITISAGGKFEGSIADQLQKLSGKDLKIEKLPDSKEIFKMSLSSLQRPLYLTASEGRILTGSFSQTLVERAAKYDYKQHKGSFQQLSDQQHENALSILYVNYGQLQPLFKQLFINNNPDLFRAFRLMPAKAALSLNYKTDALMFNGLTQLDVKKPISYLNLFSTQQPVENHLKEILPSTTAYSISFAVSNTPRFVKDLALWNNKSGAEEKKKNLLRKIKTETGVNLDTDFNNQLGHEFAVVTTRFEEKLAIVEIKNGQQLFPTLADISNMTTADIGQFNYTQLPFYLLGDAFGVFNKPYFTIINNYLILANTAGEIRSYMESYANQKFLSKTVSYNEFNNLVSERCNVEFFIDFKNIKQVFKRNLKPLHYQKFEEESPGFKDYYAASYQLSAAEKNYYTNFCMKLSRADSSKIANK